MAFGKAGEVEPVASPMLAIVRTGKQPVHELFVSIRRSIGDKSFDLFRIRRQTDQIEVDTANELAPARGGIGAQPCRFLPSKDEIIDRRPSVNHIADNGWFYLMERLKCPKLARRGGDLSLCPRC